MRSRYSPFHVFASLILALAISSILGCEAHDSTKEGISTVKSADGSSIAYGVRGEGDITIVFIHGWTCNHGFWDPQIEHFSKNHRVVWLDLAGHGLSGSKRENYTVSAFGEDVAAVVNRTTKNNIILVGHSMGGPVAIEAADLLGEKVLGIVAVDIFVSPLGLSDSEQKIQEIMKPFEGDFKTASENFVRPMFNPTADPRVVEWIVEIMSGADKDMAVSALRETLQWLVRDSSSALKKYAEKLHNINGTHDTTPAGKKAASYDNVITIPDVNHFVPQVKPDAFNRALETIISEYGKSQ
uniref:Pimeloyl-ACP methyl ester carboxylesterase n=1 Tax=Candidatus Kentrum sp. LPFa TaxID=2126335 RepID=A0A450WE34_9GAMM|nr:MAG: Pimeloyl-ACP methyl ester carboxylesterase [Candidatus Kentron sp. LPFa]